MTANKMKTLLVLVAVLIAVPVWAAEMDLPGSTVDLNKMTCKELMQGNDNDREIGIAFYHGFLAGKKDNTLINLHKTSAHSELVRDYCLSNPTSTVMDAFTKSAK